MNFNEGVDEFWKLPEERPQFLQRTNVAYARLPVKNVLEDRGIENRLLDSLICALPDGAIVAGGFMTAVVAETKDATDIDVFFTSEKAFLDAVRVFTNPEDCGWFDEQEGWAIKGYKLDEKTALDLVVNPQDWDRLRRVRYLKFVHPSRPPIQLIKLVWYESAEHVIDSFDLTVAQFALDCTTGELVFNPISWVDIARKRIVLHRMQFPASTLRRVIKYSKKGYYACPGSLIKIAQATQETLNQQPGIDGHVVYVD